MDAARQWHKALSVIENLSADSVAEDEAICSSSSLTPPLQCEFL